MKICKNRVDLILAENRKSITDICAKSGMSRTRFYAILNSNHILPKTAGKFADALGVSVSEIVEGGER